MAKMKSRFPGSCNICGQKFPDGDDWGRNNIRTGGAGAIGFRVPYTEELASELRTLQSKSESAKGASK